MKPKYILISGGSYAPSHKGHLNNWCTGIDEYYKYIKKTDKKIKIEQILLIVIPVSDNYKKASVQDVSYKNRVDLLNHLLSHKKKKYNIIIGKFHPSVVSSSQEIAAVQKKYKIKPAILFGADLFIDILKGKWFNGNESKKWDFLTSTTFVISCSPKVADKRGYCKKIETLFDKELKKSNISIALVLYPIPSDKSEISSTTIRNKIAKYRQTGKISILSPFLFKDQISYILKHRLWVYDHQKTHKKHKTHKRKRRKSRSRRK